jgi:hypothetical protein
MLGLNPPVELVAAVLMSRPSALFLGWSGVLLRRAGGLALQRCAADLRVMAGIGCHVASASLGKAPDKALAQPAMLGPTQVVKCCDAPLPSFARGW